MAGIDRGDLYSGFKKGKSPSLPGLQPTWQSKPAVVGLDPRQFDPKQKVPSEWTALTHGLNKAATVATGFNPKQMAQGLYAWRHPVRMYQHQQQMNAQLAANIKAAQAQGMSLSDMVKHGIVPVSAGTVVDLGGGMGKTNLMRPIGHGNDLASRLKVLDMNISKHKNSLEAMKSGQRGFSQDNIPGYEQFVNDLIKLRKNMANVDINSIMKKQPHQMTRAEFFAHPYTVFHKAEEGRMPGLGWIGQGFHAGTLQAANDRALGSGIGIKHGTKLHGAWITPTGGRKTIAEQALNNSFHVTPAPGEHISVLSDSAANAVGDAYDPAWRTYWHDFEGKKPSPHYRESPAEVKQFMKAMRDPQQRNTLTHAAMMSEYQANALGHSVFPYLNDAEDRGSISYVTHDPAAMHTHEAMIVKAALAGEKIPAAVMRDYPSLRSAIKKAQRNGGATDLGYTAKRNVRPSKGLFDQAQIETGARPANRAQEYQRVKDIIDNAFAHAEQRKQQWANAAAIARPGTKKMPKHNPPFMLQTYDHNSILGSFEQSIYNDHFTNAKSAHDALDALAETGDALHPHEYNTLASIIDEHFENKQAQAAAAQVKPHSMPVPPIYTTEGQHIDDLHFFQDTTKDYSPHVQVNAAETYFMGHGGDATTKSLTDHVKNWGGFTGDDWNKLSTAMKQYWINDYLHTKLSHYNLSGKPYEH